MDRTKRPSDVNEALSSMLWTPYDHSPSISSSDESETIDPIYFTTIKRPCDSLPVPYNLPAYLLTASSSQQSATKEIPNRLVRSFTDDFQTIKTTNGHDNFNRFSNDFTQLFPVGTSVPPLTSTSTSTTMVEINSTNNNYVAIENHELNLSANQIDVGEQTTTTTAPTTTTNQKKIRARTENVEIFVVEEEHQQRRRLRQRGIENNNKILDMKNSTQHQSVLNDFPDGNHVNFVDSENEMKNKAVNISAKLKNDSNKIFVQSHHSDYSPPSPPRLHHQQPPLLLLPSFRIPTSIQPLNTPHQQNQPQCNFNHLNYFHNQPTANQLSSNLITSIKQNPNGNISHENHQSTSSSNCNYNNQNIPPPTNVNTIITNNQIIDNCNDEDDYDDDDDDDDNNYIVDECNGGLGNVPRVDGTSDNLNNCYHAVPVKIINENFSNINDISAPNNGNFDFISDNHQIIVTSSSCPATTESGNTNNSYGGVGGSGGDFNAQFLNTNQMKKSYNSFRRSYLGEDSTTTIVNYPHNERILDLDEQLSQHPFVITPIVSTISVLPSLPIRRPPAERSGKGCCVSWFAGPPLRALIVVVALGGLACTLGGAAIGITGLSGSTTSHLTAALLMIGVGVILIMVSGAAWHMTAPGVTSCLPDFNFRTRADMEACGGRNLHSDEIIFPQLQQRPPPPSYQASMQEYRLRLMMMERNRMNFSSREASPPPSYTKAILDANRQQEQQLNLKCDLLPS